MEEVGFIGAGNIGEPMVERLLEAGRRVVVYARRQEIRDRLTARGATIVETPGELASLPCVITCLFSEDHVLELCTPIVWHMRPGTVFISHTTGGLAAIRTLSEIGSANDVAVVEAPFSGTPEAVRAGNLTVLLAGDDDAVQAAAGVVQAYADAPQRTGGQGTALAAKLLNNALFAAHTQATLAALEAGESLGLEQHTLLGVLAASSGGSTAADYISRSGVDARSYSDRVLRYLRKDVASVRLVAAELDVDVADLVAAAERGPLDV